MAPYHSDVSPRGFSRLQNNAMDVHMTCSAVSSVSSQYLPFSITVFSMFLRWYLRGQYSVKKKMERRLLLSTLILYSAAAVLGADNYTEYGGYRIPNIYSPSLYNIHLIVPEDVFTGNSTIFTGNVSVIFQVTEATDQILIHAPVTISIVSLGASLAVVPNVTNVILNTNTSIITISLSSALEIQTDYTLTIEYEGAINITYMRGFYRSTYEDISGTQYLLATQFESTSARQAFPCFDEPRLKAQFDISITYPQGYNVMSNTPQLSRNETNATYETVTFERTPRMSTYLVAFLVSKFTCTPGANITGGIPHQVCSRNDTAADRALANEVGPQLIQIMENVTNITYSSMDINKMDQSAIPDFNAGAMENWGLVKYRESALLFNTEESPTFYIQRIVSIIAHEFAHMWFGNLVTMDWWDYTFLNEGFARYFQYFATDKLYPSWEMGLQFIVEQQQSAFLVDGLNSSRALTSQAATPTEIEDKFDIMSYGKGACIFRMLENLIGYDHFVNAIRQYLSNHASSTAVPLDLVDDFSSHVSPAVLPENVTLRGVLDNWFNESGYPVVTVSVNGTDVILTQKRFLYNGSSSVQWYVPISYSTASNLTFENVSATAWLVPGNNLTLRNVLSSNDWILLNSKSSAYYRVNYDKELWRRITQILLTNHTVIDRLNRAQIVSDVFNFARAGELTYEDSFSIFEYLKNETDYYPWYSAIVGFNYLLERYGENSTIGSRLITKQLELLQNVYNSVNFTDSNTSDHVYILKRSNILIRACKLGETSCVETSRSLFEASKNGTRIDKDLRSVVYCTVLRYSTNIEEDWRYLWELYKNNSAISTVQDAMLSIFGCTKNSTYLTDALEKSLNVSEVRLQDFLTLWTSVMISNSEGVDAAFNFFANNHQRIANRYSNPGSLLSSISSLFTTEEQIEKLDQLINTGNLTESLKESATNAARNARSNLEWASSKRSQFESYFGISVAVPASNGNIVMFSTFTLILVLVLEILVK